MISRVIEKLKWDSNFWGINIYDLRNIKDINSHSFANCEEGAILIQALVSENDISIIEGITDFRFSFCESKVTLTKNVESTKDLAENKFRKIKKLEVESIKDNFFDLYGENSRYSIFEKAKVNDFYYIWVINSITGQMNDECYGYYIGNDLAGFITYSYGDTEVNIGLIGVLPKFQKRGIGQMMLDFVNNKAFEKKLTKIYVATQGKNITAINAYIKNGFIFKNIKYYYYYFKK